jgi:hypothetical protein
MIQEIPKDTPAEEILKTIRDMIRSAPPGATIEIIMEEDHGVPLD